VLSERERRILDDIEAGIAQESPQLVRRLQTARLDSCWRRRRYDLTVLCSFTVNLLCLLLAKGGGTLGAAGVAAGLAVVTMVLRHKLFPYRKWRWLRRYSRWLVD
jgi:hypothetical protein